MLDYGSRVCGLAWAVRTETEEDNIYADDDVVPIRCELMRFVASEQYPSTCAQTRGAAT